MAAAAHFSATARARSECTRVRASTRRRRRRREALIRFGMMPTTSSQCCSLLCGVVCLQQRSLSRIHARALQPCAARRQGGGRGGPLSQGEAKHCWRAALLCCTLGSRGRAARASGSEEGWGRGKEEEEERPRAHAIVISKPSFLFSGWSVKQSARSGGERQHASARVHTAGGVVSKRGRTDGGA